MARMELSPQAVAAATFKTVKRGYDPDEVRAYLIEVSAALEASHQQATAMEARARAAIAKLQDATQQAQQAAQHTGPVPVVAAPTVAAEDAEAISRTLLLAQRTADATVAEARAQAVAITEQAQTEASTVTASAKREAAAALEQARAEAARVLDEARSEATRAKSEQHLRAEAEVRELQLRRESLVADLDTLERHAARQRERIREAAEALSRLAQDVPADDERPVLTAADPAAPGTTDPATAAPAATLTNGERTGSHLLAPPVGGSLLGTGPVTGQVPLQPGVEPLVSPRPTSAEEVRSMWAEAERAEREARSAAPTKDDPTPVEGVIGLDESTPTEGIAR